MTSAKIELSKSLSNNKDSALSGGVQVFNENISNTLKTKDKSYW